MSATKEAEYTTTFRSGYQSWVPACAGMTSGDEWGYAFSDFGAVFVHAIFSTL